MTLGEKILQARKDRGLSQEQLATQVGVSRQAISKWELGESTPELENILQLSKVFSLSTDYLLLDSCEPALAMQSSVPTKKSLPLRPVLILGILLAGLGLLGQGFLWVLSTSTVLQVPNAPQLSYTDATHLSDTYLRSYSLYIEHYHLQGVSAMLWVLVLIGLFLLAFWLIRRRVLRN